MYGQDKYPCENCSRPTKRINADLELPSCSVRCDTALEEIQHNDPNQFEPNDIFEDHPRIT